MFVYESPVGTLYISERNNLVSKVSFEDMQEPASGTNPYTVHMLNNYFEEGIPISIEAGVAKCEDVYGLLSWAGIPSFRLKVLQELDHLVPYGTTASYSQVAAKLGSPGASRAVGAALARNPFPVIIPCHRVIPAGGGLGHYIGGTLVKRRLLEWEADKRERIIHHG